MESLLNHAPDKRGKTLTSRNIKKAKPIKIFSRREKMWFRFTLFAVVIAVGNAAYCHDDVSFMNP